MVKNNVKISKRYLSSWFFLDLMASIPIFSYIKTKENKCIIINETDNLVYYSTKLENLHYILVFVKVLKIFKVFKNNIFLNKISDNVKKIKIIDNWGNVFLYLFFLLFSLHFGACVFIFIGRNCYPGWIEIQNLQNENFSCIYVCAFYFLITTVTTVGYGDIVGKTLIERIFQIIILIAGTCVYSWIVSSVSNYIKNMNEASIQYENRLSIIEDIKLKNTGLNEKLYEKVLRVLHYRKYYEEIDKNIILDLLPYSLKNTLIVHMYKTIIDNFIFFRKLDHPNFLAQVVTLWKPILSIKGDILVDEGDYIEDIIFNKNGILSLEVRIDLNHPKQFIEDYLIKYDLIKKNKISDDDIQQIKKTSLRRSSIYQHLPDYSFNNTDIFIRSNDYYLKKDDECKNNFHFVKIVNIRENEHFGDVLMFLNQKSPLYVKVQSKKAELFFLRKMDAINISSLYSNIWKKINRKSLFNMKQIKNLIIKNITFYCHLNGIKSDLIPTKKQSNNYLMPLPSFQTTLINYPLEKNGLIKALNNNLNGMNFTKNIKISSIIKKNDNETIFEELKAEEESNSGSNFSKKNIKKTKNNNNSYLKLSIPGTNITKKEINSISNSIGSNSKCKLSEVLSLKSKEINDEINYREGSNNKESSCIVKKEQEIMNNIGKITIMNKQKDKRNSIQNKEVKKNNLNPINGNKIYNICANLNSSKKTKKSRKSKKPKKRTKNDSLKKYSSENVNEEIYPNENFDIIINEDNLKSDDDPNIFNNNIKTLSKIISQKPVINNLYINEANFDGSISQSHQQIIKVNINFKNVSISKTSTLEILSSYENINEITNYKYIKDEDLKKQTKLFLQKKMWNLFFKKFKK